MCFLQKGQTPKELRQESQEHRRNHPALHGAAAGLQTFHANDPTTAVISQNLRVAGTKESFFVDMFNTPANQDYLGQRRTLHARWNEPFYSW